MSERDRTNAAKDPEERTTGPNLFVAYGLVVLGLLMAMAIAAFIVWPYYKAR